MFKKLNFLTPIVCVFTMAGPVQAEKPRVGTVESELINHQGMLDSISMRLDRKKDELEVYRNYQEKKSLWAMKLRSCSSCSRTTAISIAGPSGWPR
jgi:hypothetical protein